MEAEGIVAKQIGSRGYFAKVSLQYTSCGFRRIILASTAEDAWHRSQGWLTAATFGVSLGLELACATGECVIARIHGLPCDTSAGLVAIAGVRAVWTALQFVPLQPLADAVEDCILRGHRLSLEEIKVELTFFAR